MKKSVKNTQTKKPCSFMKGQQPVKNNVINISLHHIEQITFSHRSLFFLILKKKSEFFSVLFCFLFRLKTLFLDSNLWNKTRIFRIFTFFTISGFIAFFKRTIFADIFFGLLQVNNYIKCFFKAAVSFFIECYVGEINENTWGEKFRNKRTHKRKRESSKKKWKWNFFFFLHHWFGKSVTKKIDSFFF